MKYLSKDYLRENYLAHYASPYYDPVKAHEYYMKNRELKGRKSASSTTGLNEKGRQAAQYAKSQINAERDAKLEQRKNKYDSDRTTRKDTYTNDRKNALDEKTGQLTSISNKFKSEKEEHTAAKNEAIMYVSNHIKNEVTKLQSELKGMSSSQRAAKALEYRNKINSLRAENADVRDRVNQSYNQLVSELSSQSNTEKTKVNADYKEKSTTLSSDYSRDTKTLQTDYTTDKKNIRDEAQKTYESELANLKNVAEFKQTKKGRKSSSSRKSSTKTKGSGPGTGDFLKRYYEKHGK